MNTNQPEAQRWLQYAQSDLLAARTLLNNQDYPRQVAFLAQQAAEKALKALLILLNVKIPHTHDLDLLREKVPAGWPVKVAFPELYGLSIWAVESRYPSDQPDITEGEAREALELAESVYATISHDIHAHPGSLE